uniref:Uncharacterized protein n=1 Tax=Romanomermis culicivorax TaxID=13658 RepID=A0A915IWV4_ROMCU
MLMGFFVDHPDLTKGRLLIPFRPKHALTGHLCFMQPVGSEEVEEEDILKIFEVWHYDKVEQYHPTKNPEGGLFTQYVNTFIKMELFSQQNNMDKTIIHNAPKEYFELVMNVVNVIKNVRLINKQIVSTTYCPNDAFAELAVVYVV